MSFAYAACNALYIYLCQIDQAYRVLAECDFVYVYACMHVCNESWAVAFDAKCYYVYVYACISIYICGCVCVYIYVCVCMYVCMYSEFSVCYACSAHGVAGRVRGAVVKIKTSI